MKTHSPSKTLKFRNLLWKLHYELAKKSIDTSFEKLADDPRYRASALAICLKSDNKKQAELASTILEQEILLGINYELQDEEIEILPVTETRQKVIAAPPKSLGSKTALLIALMLMMVAGYLFMQTRLSAGQVPDKATLSVPQAGGIASIDDVHKQPIQEATSASSDSVIELIQDDVDGSVSPLTEKPIAEQRPVTAAEHAQAETPVTKTTVLRMHGSNTIGEKLASALMEAYLKQLGAQQVKTVVTADVEKSVQAMMPGQGWVEVEIQAHGSSTAFKDLEQGTTDLGMASRRIKGEERGSLLESLGDLSRPNSEHVVGLDGLAIIVNMANPIDSLNTQQLAALFAGEVKNWSELGGDDREVVIFSRDGNSGTWDTFKNLVLKKFNKKLSTTAKRYESSTELSDLVAATPGAIGFIGLPYVRHAKLLAVADDAGAQAIVPTSFTVGTEDYPLSRRLFFYSPAIQSEFMRDFLEFTQSDAGQDVVRHLGFISQNLYLLKPPVPEAAPDEYKQLTHNAKRLSLNFRFQSGSEQLDNKALRDIQRLTRYLVENPAAQVSLFGFSDSIGDADYNQKLSEERASKVEAELQRRGIFPAQIKGFGEHLPVASNASEAGRNKNRRVEIWITG